MKDPLTPPAPRFFRRASDRSLLREGGRANRDRGGIYDGTVGWEDGGDHFDIDSSGVTLIKVTLFKGRNPTTDPPKDSARAKGTRILARISAPLYHVPPDGAEVHVSVPAGRMLDPGAPVIVAQPVPSPSTQFNGTKAKMDFGPDYDLVIKARSITLTDYEDRYLTLGPKYGLKIGDADANGCQLKNAQWLFYTTHSGTAATTFMLSRDNGIALLHDDGVKTCMKMSGGEWMGVGNSFKAMFGAGYLGVAANPLPPQAIAMGPVGPANVVSASWYVSPT